MIFYIIPLLYCFIGIALLRPLKPKKNVANSNYRLTIFFVRLYVVHAVLFSFFLGLLIFNDFIFEFNKSNNIQYLFIITSLITITYIVFLRNRTTIFVKKIFLFIDVLLIAQLVVILSINSYTYLFNQQQLSTFSQTKLIGHGGMGSQYKYPKNTLPSLQAIWKTNCRGTEIDLQMTKDSVLVLYHNENLEHITNGTGKIFEKTWDEIKTYHYYSVFSNQLTILSLTDFLRTIPLTSDFLLSLDCRFYDNSTDQKKSYQTFIRALKKTIPPDLFEKHILVECNLDFVGWDEVLSENLSEANVIATGNIATNTLVEKAIKYNFFGIGQSINYLTASKIKAIHEKGLSITVWDVYTTEKQAKAISHKIDVVQTDAKKIKKTVE